MDWKNWFKQWFTPDPNGLGYILLSDITTLLGTAGLDMDGVVTKAHSVQEATLEEAERLFVEIDEETQSANKEYNAVLAEASTTRNQKLAETAKKETRATAVDIQAMKIAKALDAIQCVQEGV